MNSITIITGAAGGIGAGLARVAAARGHTVVLADRDEPRLLSLAADIGPRAISAPSDVTDRSSMEQLADRAFEAGQPELLFANAGVLDTGLSWEISEETWRRSLDVNIMGVVNTLAAFVPRMVAAGKPARVIITASVGGFLPTPFMAPYSTTKFALVALAEGLAGELAVTAPFLSVSLLAPGPVKSGIFDAEPDAASAEFVDLMRNMLDEKGISGDDLAERTFAAIDKDAYWIVPQPERLDKQLVERQTMIATRRNPQFPKR